MHYQLAKQGMKQKRNQNCFSSHHKLKFNKEILKKKDTDQELKMSIF